MPAEEKEEKEEKHDDTPITMDKVNEAIEKALQPIKDMLSGSSTDNSDDGEKKEGGDDKEERRQRMRTRRTFSDIERDAEALVQREVQKVLSDKEHLEEHKKLEAEREKKVVEKSPVKERTLTRLLLGKGYQESHNK